MQLPDQETRDLQRSIQASKVARAAALSEAEKLRMGADLYDDGMRWLTQVIRAQAPGCTDRELDAEIERRKRIARQIDEAALFQSCGEISEDD